MIKTVGVVLAAAFLLLVAAPAFAHLTPNSEVRLTFAPDAVIADAVIPQGEYAYATGLGTTNSAADLAAAARYIAGAVVARGPDGRSWRVTVERTAFVQLVGAPDLSARARLVPPAGAPADRLRLEWRAITREVPSHFALIVEGGDLSGRDDGARRLIGAVTAAQPFVEVVRHDPSGLALLGSSIALGARHIAEGYDHLLFLLALLLPAPLLAAAGRWRGRRGWRGTLRLLALVTGGFTLGHSLTLAAAAGLDWHLPAAPVEAGIALSVLISAIHAMRPLFPGREVVVAALFGLVHGLAFATLVSGLGILRGNRALAILGFNLGIEAMQLLVVAACLPAILWLGGAARREPLRRAAAGAIALAALVWLAERLGAGPLLAGGVLERAIPWAFALVCAGSLAVVGAAVMARFGVQPRHTHRPS